MNKLLEIIFNKENLARNGLIIIIILLILILGGSLYTQYKILTNDTHDRKEREERISTALIRSAVSDEKLAGIISEVSANQREVANTNRELLSFLKGIFNR